MAPSEIHTARTVLHEIATHAYNLAMGLQNVAPPQATSGGASVQYLKEISIKLEETSKKIAELDTESEK
jgi:hypothetical protein